MKTNNSNPCKQEIHRNTWKKFWSEKQTYEAKTKPKRLSNLKKQIVACVVAVQRMMVKPVHRRSRYYFVMHFVKPIWKYLNESKKSTLYISGVSSQQTLKFSYICYVNLNNLFYCKQKTMSMIKTYFQNHFNSRFFFFWIFFSFVFIFFFSFL